MERQRFAVSYLLISLENGLRYLRTRKSYKVCTRKGEVGIQSFQIQKMLKRTVKTRGDERNENGKSNLSLGHAVHGIGCSGHFVDNTTTVVRIFTNAFSNSTASSSVHTVLLGAAEKQDQTFVREVYLAYDSEAHPTESQTLFGDYTTYLTFSGTFNEKAVFL